MNKVLDASVAFKWVVAEKDDDKARRLRDDYRNAVVELIAPEVFPFDLAHSLTRAERQKRISVGDALTLWADVMTTPPRIIPSLPLTPRAIEISSIMRIGIYDCLYVALAEWENCELVTADTKLISNLVKQFPFIVDLSTLP